jgi:hypothetical protein
VVNKTVYKIFEFFRHFRAMRQENIFGVALNMFDHLNLLNRLKLGVTEHIDIGHKVFFRLCRVDHIVVWAFS